jgi:hypothetical protein
LPAAVQQVQGKTFQIQSVSRDFEGVIKGVEGQRVEPLRRPSCRMGLCGHRFPVWAASESSKGNVPPSNSSQTMSRGGFTVAPGQRIPQSVSVKFRDGLIFYYLIFSAAKGEVE